MISRTFYFKCRQSAIFNSVISPAPEMRLISSNFLPIARAVTADGLNVLRDAWDLDRAEIFRLDFINKGYRLNVYILYLCDFFKNLASLF
jgi:hypothetical protein